MNNSKFEKIKVCLTCNEPYLITLNSCPDDKSKAFKVLDKFCGQYGIAKARLAELMKYGPVVKERGFFQPNQIHAPVKKVKQRGAKLEGASMKQTKDEFLIRSTFLKYLVINYREVDLAVKKNKDPQTLAKLTANRELVALVLSDHISFLVNKLPLFHYNSGPSKLGGGVSQTPNIPNQTSKTALEVDK